MPEPLSIDTLRIPSSTAELERVDTATEDIARSMGFDDSARADLGICVTEAVNNAIVHGHKGRVDLPIDIRFERFADALRVHVRDYGDGFDVAGIADPTQPENLLKVTGRGVHLIRALMDEVEIHARERGMEVIMTKRRK
jgi:serine/threonine-protein kinase RsbW